MCLYPAGYDAIPMVGLLRSLIVNIYDLRAEGKSEDEIEEILGDQIQRYVEMKDLYNNNREEYRRRFVYPMDARKSRMIEANRENKPFKEISEMLDEEIDEVLRREGLLEN